MDVKVVVGSLLPWINISAPFTMTHIPVPITYQAYIQMLIFLPLDLTVKISKIPVCLLNYIVFTLQFFILDKESDRNKIISLPSHPVGNSIKLRIRTRDCYPPEYGFCMRLEFYGKDLGKWTFIVSIFTCRDVIFWC